jgi:hypothetical protein
LVSVRGTWPTKPNAFLGATSTGPIQCLLLNMSSQALKHKSNIYSLYIITLLISVRGTWPTKPNAFATVLFMRNVNSEKSSGHFGAKLGIGVTEVAENRCAAVPPCQRR